MSRIFSENAVNVTYISKMQAVAICAIFKNSYVYTLYELKMW